MAYYVYQILESTTGLPIYIGCSMYPKQRFRQHHTDPGSAIYWHLNEPEMEFRLEILDCLSVKSEALALEAHLISITPGALNRC